MYTENSIDLVRNADIVAVISHFTELKRQGSSFEAKESPFNGSKGSFKVTPSLNIFKCFSTGIGGDGIKFVMTYKNASYTEALKIIAEIVSITLIEEKLDEDQERKKNHRQEMFDLTAIAVSKYQKELHNLQADHWVKQLIQKREINDETITKFNIGFAPKNFQFLTNPIIEKGKIELGKTVGLINAKEGRSFDFFVDRLIFPIQDIRGNFVGFGGRQNDGIDGPKYLNSKDSDLYNKSQHLYGLYQSKEFIQKEKTAILVEGYTDVTGMFQNECPLAVANCGTAKLSEVQLKLLQRFANHIIICRDNDGLDDQGNEQKGTLAALRDIDILLSAGFKVSIVILPVGEDPDSFAQKIKADKIVEATKRKLPIQFDNIKDYIFQEMQDAIIWKTQKLKNKVANDPNLLSDMVTEVAQMLFQIKDDIKRSAYLEQCRKLIKQPIKVLKDKIESFVKVAEVKASQNKSTKQDVEIMGLPEGADYKEFIEKGFVTHGNSIYLRNRDHFFKGSNFSITPLFHVYGKQDNKRLCEVISETGKKKIIDFDSSDFIQMAKFEGKLLDEGNFTFAPDVNPNHFKLIRNYIFNEFILAYELKTLGWQQEKFLAFANCVFHNGILKEANSYGIVQIDKQAPSQEALSEQDTQEAEYREDVKHFYSPSASVMYKFTRDGDDPYENDRYFVYKKAPISITDWMIQMQKVYGKKANTGIAFAFASLFRDIYLRRYQFFPHLFLTGEKGSGKSKFGESLVAIFTYKQEPFDLNSGTPVAFYRRLSRIMNVPTMLEEYHDSVDDRIFQPLKGAYDGRGREMGKATGDNRTTTTKVNCSLILLSQYLSSRDDNSLTSRSIVEHFIKPLESFSTLQIEDYSLLKSWEETGMSSFLCDILTHRELVEENIHTVYAALSKKMKADLQGKEYQERMLQNYLSLLVPVTILRPHFDFPFTELEVWDQFKEAILDSSDLIIESEGLSEFWRILEFLLDTGRIKENYQFEIEIPNLIKFQTRKGEPDLNWINTAGEKILFLRLNAVHQLYHKEVSTREGVDVISENTFKNYIKSKKYFLGAVKSRRFQDTATSAYVLNYSMMEAQGILNLIRIKQDLFNDEPEPDLPY